MKDAHSPASQPRVANQPNSGGGIFRSPWIVDAPSWGLWLSRWLLVLLLIGDQIGSPLHHHHHDSGIDGSWLTATHDSGPTGMLHLEGWDGGPSFAHAVTAVQQQTKGDPLVASAAARPAPFFAFTEFINLAPAVATVPRPDQRPPAYSSHRSLPPAGRAPPLHA